MASPDLANRDIREVLKTTFNIDPPKPLFLREESKDPRKSCGNWHISHHREQSSVFRAGNWLSYSPSCMTAAQIRDLRETMNEAIKKAALQKNIEIPPEALFSHGLRLFHGRDPSWADFRIAISEEGLKFLGKHDILPDLSQVMAHAEHQKSRVLRDITHLENRIIKASGHPGWSRAYKDYYTADSLSRSPCLQLPIPIRHPDTVRDQEAEIFNLCNQLNEGLSEVAEVKFRPSREDRDGLDSAYIEIFARNMSDLTKAVERLEGDLAEHLREMARRAVLLEEPYSTLRRRAPFQGMSSDRRLSTQKSLEHNARFHPDPEPPLEPVSDQLVHFAVDSWHNASTTESWLQKLVKIAGEAEETKDPSASPKDAILRSGRAKRVLKLLGDYYPALSENIRQLTETSRSPQR